jgi:hypothetical protein
VWPPPPPRRARRARRAAACVRAAARSVAACGSPEGHQPGPEPGGSPVTRRGATQHAAARQAESQRQAPPSSNKELTMTMRPAALILFVAASAAQDVYEPCPPRPDPHSMSTAAVMADQRWQDALGRVDKLLRNATERGVRPTCCMYVCMYVCTTPRNCCIISLCPCDYVCIWSAVGRRPPLGTSPVCQGSSLQSRWTRATRGSHRTATPQTLQHKPSLLCRRVAPGLNPLEFFCVVSVVVHREIISHRSRGGGHSRRAGTAYVTPVTCTQDHPRLTIWYGSHLSPRPLPRRSFTSCGTRVWCRWKILSPSTLPVSSTRLPGPAPNL